MEGHPPGNLLTGTYPYQIVDLAPTPEGERQGQAGERPLWWKADGKDHLEGNWSTITVSGIAVGCVDASVTRRSLLV